MQRILVVDDEPMNRAVLSGLLEEHYDVTTTDRGDTALFLARRLPQPDLILLDVMMDGMDGYEVLRRLREDDLTHDIPVMFLTALDDRSQEERGLELGAMDYLTKPVHPGVLMARVRTQLLAKHGRDWLRDQNAALNAEVARRMEANELAERVTIRALAHLAETRDPETGNHILRTQNYVATLARRLSRHPRFERHLDGQTVDLMVKSAPLHDIGKVGIPDHILRKAGPLDPQEWLVMKTHARLGYEAIEKVEVDVEGPVAFLRLAKEIARWHHERWDGMGYPDGLRGDAIPVSARLMALADVFDALITQRVYKPAFPLEQARQLIVQGRGGHFDPDVVDAFEAEFDTFTDIAHRYADHRDEAAVAA